MKFKPFSRTKAAIAVALCALVTTDSYADAPKAVPSRGPATIKEVMTLVVEPASNGIFQVGGEPPKTDAQWKTLQGQALTLLEVANNLVTANRFKDQKQWPIDAKALQAAGKQAFAAAMAKNVDALMDLSDPLYNTCAGCHEHFMPKQ